jgi:uncharacterized damage-inducible protein DinB
MFAHPHETREFTMLSKSNRATLTAAIMTVALCNIEPAHAQSSQMDDFMTDLAEVQEKLLGLANAMSAEQYAWRPGEGVRSVGEVFQHVTADNFLMTAPYIDIPQWTAMDAADYSTVQAFESRDLDRAQIIEELEQSFAHIKSTMETMTDTKLAESVSFFGQTWTGHRVWVLALVHIHEHLGQSIAYARTNGVVPPWSR